MADDDGKHQENGNLHVELLKKWKLSKYVDVFVENDWDEVEIWKELTDDIMANVLGLGIGAIHKFKWNFKKWCVESATGNVEQTESEDIDHKQDQEQPQFEEHAFPYLHGNWSDHRNRYGSPAGWSKDSNGLVRLHGVISMRTGYHNETVTTLPDRAHPTRFIYVNRVDSRGVTVTIYIYCHGSSHGKSGEIKVRNNSNSTKSHFFTKKVPPIVYNLLLETTHYPLTE